MSYYQKNQKKKGQQPAKAKPKPKTKPKYVPTCTDCGVSEAKLGPQDEMYRCASCGEPICDECASTCERGCGRHYCERGDAQGYQCDIDYDHCCYDSRTKTYSHAEVLKTGRQLDPTFGMSSDSSDSSDSESSDPPDPWLDSSDSSDSDSW